MYIALFTDELPRATPIFKLRIIRTPEMIVRASIILPWFYKEVKKTGSALEFAEKNNLPTTYTKYYQYHLLKCNNKWSIIKTILA